jgi:hypothetical protein
VFGKIKDYLLERKMRKMNGTGDMQTNVKYFYNAAAGQKKVSAFLHSVCRG